MTNSTVNASYAQPIGSTDSFGGGGGQFGGYDGKVHKSWVSNLAPYKTNSTLTGICLDENSASRLVLSWVPLFFAIGIACISLAVMFSALRNFGFLGGEDDY
jgi:hypothetical protein